MKLSYNCRMFINFISKFALFIITHYLTKKYTEFFCDTATISEKLSEIL